MREKNLFLLLLACLLAHETWKIIFVLLRVVILEAKTFSLFIRSLKLERFAGFFDGEDIHACWRSGKILEVFEFLMKKIQTRHVVFT